MLRKFEKTFAGSLSSLQSCLYATEINELTASVKKAIHHQVVLYTDHIEAKYFSRHYESVFLHVPERHYIDAYLGDERLAVCNTVLRTCLFAALDIPRAKERGMPVHVFESFVRDLLDQVDRARKSSGDYAGVEAAQSLSERLTQSALNTFHSAGAKKSVVVGMRRVKEILDATKLMKTPMLGPFRTKHDTSGLVAVCLRDLALGAEVEELDEKRVLRVRTKSQDALELFLRHMNKNKRFKAAAVTERNDVILPEDFKIRWDATVSGLPDSAECVTERDGEMFVFFHTRRPIPTDLSIVVETCPDVDFTSLRTNSVHWVAETLGISAAENFMAMELDRVLGGEGIHISPRHLTLIAANMCVSGKVRANTFNGLKEEERSVIRRATFERGVTVFASAALKGEVDRIADTSSKIMMAASIDATSSSVMVDPKAMQAPPARLSIVAPVKEHPPVTYSPEYAPCSDVEDEGEEELYVPASPQYRPASPVYKVSTPFPPKGVPPVRLPVTYAARYPDALPPALSPKMREIQPEIYI